MEWGVVHGEAGQVQCGMDIFIASFPQGSMARFEPE